MNDSSSGVRRRPAAVLWDMDDTIVDTEAHWSIAADEIARAGSNRRRMLWRRWSGRRW